MTAGILLIHGFTGQTADLSPLYQHLVKHDGSDCVSHCDLYGNTNPLTFDRHRLVKAIAADIHRARQRYKRLAVLGHSTGGSLALLALAEAGITAEMLVLAAVPFGFDSGARERWEMHRQGMETLSLSSVAGLVSATVAASRQPLPLSEDGTLLLLHGEDDTLVPPAQSLSWQESLPPSRSRLIIVPEAGHQLFKSGLAEVGITAVQRAFTDLARQSEGQPVSLEFLQTAEPESRRFLCLNPAARRHLAACPSSGRLQAQEPLLSLQPEGEPVFANLEITTRCNLSCPHCARQALPRAARDMPLRIFERLLDLLPHAYRVTLVGLGEPLLHPRIVDLVALAHAKGRRVTLATNAMALTASLSASLLAAGLDAIAFSLDAVDQDLASLIRPGSDIHKILRNIEEFTTQVRAQARPVAMAVFTAVSRDTLDRLDQLVKRIATLGVHVLMLSDLNFSANHTRTLWQNKNDLRREQLRRAVAHAFAAGLPVLSVCGLEEFGLVQRYRNYLLMPPDQLFQRSRQRRWCLSPWQTVPVDVEGNVAVCDCQPDARAGNLLRQPLEEIWNGEVMVRQRLRMLSEEPPAACLVCPRL